MVSSWNVRDKLQLGEEEQVRAGPQCRPRSNSELVVPVHGGPGPPAAARQTPMSRLLVSVDDDNDARHQSIGPDEFVELFYRSTALTRTGQPPRRVSQSVLLTYLFIHTRLPSD